QAVESWYATELTMDPEDDYTCASQISRQQNLHLVLAVQCVQGIGIDFELRRQQLLCFAEGQQVRVCVREEHDAPGRLRPLDLVGQRRRLSHLPVVIVEDKLAQLGRRF